MFRLIVALLIGSLSAPSFACTQFDINNEAHKQTWLALMFAKEMDSVPFNRAGAVKVDTLKSFKKISPLKYEELRDLPEVDSISQKIHKYLLVKGSRGTSEEVESALLDQLEHNGVICDLASEIDKLYTFKK